MILASLNSKFDGACGHILGQRLVPSLMEVCTEVPFEEDCPSARNILTTLAIDSTTFNARSSTHDSEKANGKGKMVPICEHCKERC